MHMLCQYAFALHFMGLSIAASIKHRLIVGLSGAALGSFLPRIDL